jgi:demethylmenaquinone methyltransferase/2-methoxy-6-polyprenyl-1,4-benzoquinol methylase
MFPLLGNRILAGLDFTRAMLDVAAADHPAGRFVEGDAQKIPFGSNCFDAAIIVYSIRNVPDVPAALKELFRILQPGGLLGILDFGVPETRFGRSLYLLYFQKIMPFLGSWIAGDKSSYHYFVRTVLRFPKRDAFLEWIRAAGFEKCRYSAYTMGAALCYLAEKPE